MALLQQYPRSSPGARLGHINTLVGTCAARSSHAAARISLRGSFKRSLTVAQVAAAQALTDEQVQQFHKNGFLVLEDFATAAEMNALRQRMKELVDEFDPKSVSVFSTKKQLEFVNKYFLDSASNISFFFEENAFKEDGSLAQSKELSLNKVGHALHDLDPVFRSFSRSSRVLEVVRAIGFKRPTPVQSMYIFKQPRIGGEVVPHQDSTFLYTNPPSCMGLWWAVEDADRSNGCLWALPHFPPEGLARRFLLNDGQLSFDKPLPTYDLSEFVPLEVKAGTLVLLHGTNVHYSAENSSPVSRHSYSMHIVESAPGFQWPAENWAHRPEDFPWEPLYS